MDGSEEMKTIEKLYFRIEYQEIFVKKFQSFYNEMDGKV